jgi:glycosyltransferase involved in cell wall biosynthesis
MKKRIVVSVISDLCTDQRVLRICDTLQQMGFEVEVIARSFNNSLPLQNYSFKASRIRCWFRKGILQYAEFNTKLFFKLLFTRTSYFLSNDLDTLIPNYIIAKLRGKHLFYDSHEYFTGVPELRHSPLKRKTWKLFENWILPRLRTVYTVNQSVKEAYEKEYPNLQFGIVRNVPVTKAVTPAPLPVNWQGKIVLLAQGAGLNEGRSCIELLEAMPLLDERFHLVFIGGGTQWHYLQQRRQELKLEDRVDMMEKMLPAQLKTYTPLAHLGFSLDSFEDKNCLYNLPNKIFDYIQAGVPVVATAIPEVKKIIEQYECGICLYDVSPLTLSTTITALMDDKKRYETCKDNTQNAAKELCWEKEEKVLMAVYQPYL